MTRSIAATPRQGFLCLFLGSLIGMGCTSEDGFLKGQWEIDVTATVADGNGQTGLKLGAVVAPKALSALAPGLVLDFDGQGTVAVSNGQKSVRRPYTVMRSRGDTVAISIDRGNDRFRRVIATVENGKVVLIDSHQRIILKRL